MAAILQPTAPATDGAGRSAAPAYPFDSILFVDADAAQRAASAVQPDCFHDLGLDQVVEAVVAPWKDDGLRAFFHLPLCTEDAVAYRQEVMCELEQPEVMAVVRGFTRRLLAMRQQQLLASKRHNEHERNRWHLSAVQLYGEAIETLRRELAPLALRSRGLRRWRDYLEGYADSPHFMRLAAQARQLLDELSTIVYVVTIAGSAAGPAPWRCRAPGRRRPARSGAPLLRPG